MMPYLIELIELSFKDRSMTTAGIITAVAVLILIHRSGKAALADRSTIFVLLSSYYMGTMIPPGVGLILLAFTGGDIPDLEQIRLHVPAIGLVLIYLVFETCRHLLEVRADDSPPSG